MASVTNDSTGWRVRFIEFAGQKNTLRPGKPKPRMCLMFLLLMTSLCRVGSAEDKKTILDTLTDEEVATLNQLPAADRVYAIACLSAPQKMNGRNGWRDLREGEQFVAVRVPSDPYSGSISVSQVVDEKNFLGYGSSVWVEGISTGGIADGDQLNVHGIPFICVGNKTYKTAIGGSQTVMHIVHVNPDDTVETLRPIAEARGLRVWGDGTGNLVLAEFVRASSRELVIKLWDGKRKTISMKDVGAIDAEWLKSENKK